MEKYKFLLDYLSEKTKDVTDLKKIVDIYEKMCKKECNVEDMLLFQTGIFDFTGERKFYFSMVRQFMDGGDELYQLELEIIYPPTEVNFNFSTECWNTDVDGDFFEFIRNTEEYITMRHEKIEKININLDET